VLIKKVLFSFVEPVNALLQVTTGKAFRLSCGGIGGLKESWGKKFCGGPNKSKGFTF
jgi:hypothetical protein